MLLIMRPGVVQKLKVTRGKPCRCPAVKGKARCRVHGGAKGSGTKQGNSNALQHGYTTAMIKNFRKTVRVTLNDTAKLTKEIYQK